MASRPSAGRARIAVAAAGAIVLGLLASPAVAQARAPPDRAATVSELVVTASKTVEELVVTAKLKCLKPDGDGISRDRPKVVSVFPGKGAVVRPGLLVMRVTFNAPMACEGRFEGEPPLQDPCPSAVQNMLLSLDRRTVRTVCLVESGLHYGARVNGDLFHGSFIGLSGLPSLPARFDFTTSSQPAVITVCDALAEDPEGVRQIRKFHELNCPGARPPSAGGNP